MTRSLQGMLAVAMGALLALGGGGCRGEHNASVPVASAPTDTSTAGDSDSTIYSAAKLPIPKLGYNAREGRVLYRHYCLNCHGDEGRGDGFNAYNLDPKPQSLADSTFQAKHSDADLITAIRSGGAAVGLSNAMPPWGKTLNERKIQNIVTYLRTLDEANKNQH